MFYFYVPFKSCKNFTHKKKETNVPLHNTQHTEKEEKVKFVNFHEL